MDKSQNLPVEFVKLLSNVVDPIQAKELCDAINQTDSITSIRLNPEKENQTKNLKSVPWCSTGYYLADRPSFTLDPDYHAGAYYVQEPSSMFLEQFITHHSNNVDSIKALDLCAAPGGKSTHLLSLLNKESLLISNEVIRSRASILTENIQKWGNANVVVTNNDPSDFTELKGFFDLIVVDAPCSGEGLFRKDPNAIQEWSIDNVQLCAQRQRRILSDILPALSQNGILIYCTCTFNSIENEENLKWLAEQDDIEFLRIPNTSDWGVTEVIDKNVIGYRFLPGKVIGEGFFISGIRKLSATNSISVNDRPDNSNSKIPSINQWLSQPSEFLTLQKNDLIKFIPKKWQTEISILSKYLNCIQTGTLAGAYKYDKFIPEHALALSIELNTENIQEVELNTYDAIKFLRKDVLNLEGIPKGLTLIKHNGNSIGWANHLGTRTNNMYPTNWRIRMTVD